MRWRLNIPKLRSEDATLQRRFVLGVLAPPFFVLVCLGLFAFWQLDGLVRKQAIGDLNRSAVTSAAKLEREFAIRETILKRTGEDLFATKSAYQADRAKLDTDREQCSAYLKKNKSFQSAPDGICDSFLTAFARQGATLKTVEDGYVETGEQLAEELKKTTSNRLSAYKQFFPETLALLVVDDKGQVVSKALSSNFTSAEQALVKDAVGARKTGVSGTLLTVGETTAAVFAYPITGGSVLAAFDTASDSFLKQTWESAPIDTREAVAVILDSQGKLVYPGLSYGSSFQAVDSELRARRSTELKLRDIEHVVTAGQAGSSKWLVAVASPKTVVLAPVRDAQLVAVAILGTLLIGFLWVGTFFIRRTIQGILSLVSGAIIFSAGNLDYRIQMERADIEFNHLADTMNKMAQRIAKAEKELDEKNKEFISVATHELRTPLTAIAGNLSLVYDDMGDQLNDTVKPLVEEAYHGTDRLKALVNDMLDVARMEGGRTEFNITRLDMGTIAKDVVDMQQVTAKEKGIALQYNGEGAKNVMADESKLRIVLGNFVSNAIKYNQPSGNVTVSHIVQDNMLVTAVKDTGLGIPDGQKAHMFEKFFRVQHADRKGVVGTGLGMYITKQYIEAMGGKLWFESTHGKGTTFYFSLPLATTAPQTNAPAAG